MQLTAKATGADKKCRSNGAILTAKSGPAIQVVGFACTCQNRPLLRSVFIEGSESDSVGIKETRRGSGNYFEMCGWQLR